MIIITYSNGTFRNKNAVPMKNKVNNNRGWRHKGEGKRKGKRKGKTMDEDWKQKRRRNGRERKGWE